MVKSFYRNLFEFKEANIMQIESRRRFRIIQSWNQDGSVTSVSFGFSVDLGFSFLKCFVFLTCNAGIVLQRLNGYRIFIHPKGQKKEQR